MTARASSLTRQAIEAAEAGDASSARGLLVQAIEEDPEYPLAWTWMSTLQDEPAHQRFCLEKAHEIDATDETRLALAALKGVTPVAPRELRDYEDPKAPALKMAAEDAPSKPWWRRSGWITLATVTLVCLVGAAIWALAGRDTRTPIYIAVVASNDPVAGPGSGQEHEAAARFAAESWNENGELGDRRFEIVYFDDQKDPKKAEEIAHQIVDDGRFTAVIGHQYTVTSLAAGPIYEAAEIPVITASATGDEVSAGNPWYFRSVYNNSSQGQAMAAYSYSVLDETSTAIIHADTAYGNTLYKAYKGAFPGPIEAEAVVQPDASGAIPDKDIEAAIKKIADAKPKGPIAILTSRPEAIKIIQGLLRAGLENQMIGSDTLASSAFYEELSKPKDISHESYSRVYVASPLTMTSLTGPAVAFREQLKDAVDYQPTWQSSLVHDAVDLIAGGLLRDPVALSSSDLKQVRLALKGQWDKARSPETAIPALTRSIYFGPEESAVRPTGVELGSNTTNGVVIDAAPKQLAEYTPEAGTTVAQSLASGDAVNVSGTVYTRQRVVHVGINYNELTSLDTGSGSFFADFFMWLRYTGDDDATDIEFVNATDRKMSLPAPMRESEEDGEKYRLYRVSGTFKSTMDFKDFPFDRQYLTITIQNRTIPSARITYTPDTELLAQPQAQRLASGVNADATIDNIPNWRTTSVLFYPSSAGNTAALGDPERVTGPQGITFSQFNTQTELARDVRSFLIKNVLPLLLLVSVTYVTVWLPFSEGGRLSMAITGILTGAVMLNTVTGSLSKVDYTVAIEWAYYAFILLSALVVLSTIIGRALEGSGRKKSAERLTSFLKVFYPVYVLAVISAYVVTYA